MGLQATAAAQAFCDGDDQLVSADEPLRGLHMRCGGVLPGTIAVPALLETVRKARRFGMKLARPVIARDGEESITAWIEVEPAIDGGCRISVRHWQSRPLPADDRDSASRLAEIDRTQAEFYARLDGSQRVLTADAEAGDLKQLVRAMQETPGEPWTAFTSVGSGNIGEAPHWRLLHGSELRVQGSNRPWRVTLVPSGEGMAKPSSFELYLTSDVVEPPAGAQSGPPREDSRLIGRDVAPVLRQPITRIIANAETIRARLAGPLTEEYSTYAADIAAAGEHLLALIDDLADLEVVESDDFTTQPDHIDLADAARRAAGILSVKARGRSITIDAPRPGETLPAVGEFRRVLQILLNLLGNAIRYSPEDSQVWMRIEEGGGMARVIIADQGPGLDAQQQAKMFDKFERLGRTGDGGSGLGLYISRRLARAMDGDLTVESAPGQGARFILSIPAGSAAG